MGTAPERAGLGRPRADRSVIRISVYFWVLKKTGARVTQEASRPLDESPPDGVHDGFKATVSPKLVIDVMDVVA